MRVYEDQMERSSTDGAHSETGASQMGAQGKYETPDEAARRDLIAWCKAHGLPVPPERDAGDTKAPAPSASS